MRIRISAIIVIIINLTLYMLQSPQYLKIISHYQALLLCREKGDLIRLHILKLLGIRLFTDNIKEAIVKLNVSFNVLECTIVQHITEILHYSNNTL